MIDLKTASQLLDFGADIVGQQRAKEQLEGAVAIHNILEQHRVAYLADEVGMGKTYVALGVLALFRHYNPDFRALIVAPRENIQNKWIKDFRNFVKNSYQLTDLRVKGFDGKPARPLVKCANLSALVGEVIRNPDRDFFMRMTSFSLSMTRKGVVDEEDVRKRRDELRRHLPWIANEVFDLRDRFTFRENVARAICCALPRFDLVIIDEGHKLKHGFAGNVAARNRVLGLVMGRDSAFDRGLFPGYGPRAQRVLFLSATPIEETYQHLWNQLDVFGMAGKFEQLKRPDCDEDTKKNCAAQFLIRRVTSINVGETELTKNLYRREWRRGGLTVHDEPIRFDDPRKRLIVALVQKKVSELLGHEKFNNSFQIGMLASFESFFQTARLTADDDDDVSNFDDSEQTDDLDERQGIDVLDVNRIGRSYQRRFGHEMPHPKMDSVVDALANAWRRGEKTLIFVRRVASVKELKRKLDELYDQWLYERLIKELPEFRERLEKVFAEYTEAKQKSRSTATNDGKDSADRGGSDSFFAWFFRGDGPSGIVSGATIARRFIAAGAVYATFFEDNYVADLLGCRPGEVEENLAKYLRMDRANLRRELGKRCRKFLSKALKHQRANKFEAVQAAAIEWLKDRRGPLRTKAGIIWNERFQSSIKFAHTGDLIETTDSLELPTFFTELRNHPELRQAIWPDVDLDRPNLDRDEIRVRFREREIRAYLLAAAARLGNPLIDLYVLTINRVGSVEVRAQETSDDEGTGADLHGINDSIRLLEQQMNTDRAARDWSSFDELSDLATHFRLILDVNVPQAESAPLHELARMYGSQLLGSQQPVGGMFEKVNQTLVRQFRMPGYPLILITTDLLQEGEDLHTFCSSVQHYGIAWTPSSIEQRIGRIDRVRSQTERRLESIAGREVGRDELLQVYFPHLQETVEVLQVQRVLERMNQFLRLMHKGLVQTDGEERTIDTTKEILRGDRLIEPVRERLESAFPVRPGHLRHAKKPLAIHQNDVRKLKLRFKRLSEATLPSVDVVWDGPEQDDLLLGTARLEHRVQPFKLLLRIVQKSLSLRCTSPIGQVEPGFEQERVLSGAARLPIWIGAVEARIDQTYDLTVEGEVLLDKTGATDLARVGMLIQRVVSQADALEQLYLPGQDEVLDTFRSELLNEVNDGR